MVKFMTFQIQANNYQALSTCVKAKEVIKAEIQDDNYVVLYTETANSDHYLAFFHKHCLQLSQDDRSTYFQNHDVVYFEISKVPEIMNFENIEDINSLCQCDLANQAINQAIIPNRHYFDLFSDSSFP